MLVWYKANSRILPGTRDGQPRERKGRPVKYRWEEIDVHIVHLFWGVGFRLTDLAAAHSLIEKLGDAATPDNNRVRERIAFLRKKGLLPKT